MLGYLEHNQCKGLVRDDFFRFSREFQQVIHDNIPTIGDIRFVDQPEQQPALILEENNKEKTLRTGMEQAVTLKAPVLSGDILFLPFSIGSSSVVAQVHGLDDHLVRKIGNDWLGSLSSLLLREFLLVKRACIDSLTGLLNSLHLEETLNANVANRKGVILLITVHQKSSSYFQAKENQHRTVSLLTTYLDNSFPLFYLGQSCYGLICENLDSAFAAEFAPLLVNYLKRERCARVHVATAPFGGGGKQIDSAEAHSEVVMKKAWAGLQVASKRGPFAFCNYNSIENMDKHPLAPPSSSLVRWLRMVSKSLNNFSVIQFDSGSDSLVNNVVSFLGNDTKCFADGDALFLILPGKSETDALNAGKEILRNYNKQVSISERINAGISSFPFCNFRESEILLNCRKALCHAAFLEPGSLVCCDAVSFNISGDIYYGDGDLVLAVKEYKRGLLLDSVNGNLLNSLGVCYAQMNKHAMAVDCFRRASEGEDGQFMAFYNLGLEQQIQDENVLAIDSFAKALALPKKEDEKKAREDISFQLSVLYIEEQDYQKSLDLLLPWYESKQSTGGGHKAVRYLGKACFGLDRHREAMKYLQRALRYNEYDAEVLGLLGEIYLKENEGDDIALRLCEKAVEISPHSIGLKVRLANAQIQCGDFVTALKTLQPCLRNKKYRPIALLQRGVLAREQGQVKVARKWFLKAESCPESDSKIVSEARKNIIELKD